jgi:hypothetical protein
MKLELNYKQAMTLLDLVKVAKCDANIKAYALQDKFKNDLTDDAKAYWAEQQDKHNNDYDLYNGILEQLRELTGEI